MKALICGVGGQDGAYLARFLLDKGYDVVGTSRDAMTATFGNLAALGIAGRVKTVSMAIDDFRSVLHVLRKHAPDEVYNLAGQTSVGLSFEQPVEAMDSIAGGTLNLLEGIRFSDRPIRLYQAGSSECFGDTAEGPANEETPFRPRSPYAVAKCTAHWLVRNYRESYGLFAGSGLVFNHESPLRPKHFVVQKIALAAARIAAGSGERLRLGTLDIERDWGWAPDYVDAMWRMLQLGAPADFVIATGRSVTLEYLVARAFAEFGLDWKDRVDIDPTLFRPSDIRVSRGDPSKAHALLGWRHTADVDQVISSMCAAAREAGA